MMNERDRRSRDGRNDVACVCVCVCVCVRACVHVTFEIVLCSDTPRVVRVVLQHHN